MAPKKPKDTTLDENYWRTCIEEAPLNEEIWNVKVILIEAAGSDQDRIYLNKFEIFAAEERRFVIKNICKTETIFMVNQLGGEKKVKDDNLRVFEEGQAFLKDKKEIPPDILALIIKHLILKMKDEYLFIKHQKLEVREGMRKESATMINRAEVRGTVNVKPPEEEKPPAPPPPPKDKNKKDQSEPIQETPELSEGKKYNTMLRVRGEEWRDKIYVDDFPIDGPNLYVAITGFVEPFLAGCLIRIGVPLTAVVQIRIDPTTIKVPSSLFRTSKRGQSQTEILTAKSQKFWEDLQQLRINNNTCDDYKNTAFIIFSPPYWETDSLSGSPENIYDEMCYLMYDIQDLTRQHNHFLDNMDVIDIPQEMGDVHSQNIYNQHMAGLPLECVTIYSILDSILQAVSTIQQMEENSSKTSLSTALTINQTRQSFKDEDKFQKAETLVKEVFKTLCNADSNKKNYRVTYGEEYETHKDPIVINYGDLAKYTIFQLGNINMNNIIGSMLYGIPIFKLWQNQNRQSGELEAKINFHVNVLLSCFDRKDVETMELNRLIHILACRKMYNNRSSLKLPHLQPSSLSEFKKVYLKRTVLAEPLPAYSPLYRSWSSITTPFTSLVKNDNKSNDSDGNSESCRIKFLFDCPDISELVSAAEIASDKPISHMIDDFEFFEEYYDVSAFQTMAHAFNSFNCVDYKYCEVTDCLILMFYNSHDKDGVAREEWRCHLPTPLCLQDFFDFILEEHYDWIKKEEDLYTENTIQRVQSEYKNCFNHFAERTCLENTEVSMDLLMEGSLKYEEMANVEEASPESDEMKTKTATISPSSVTTDMASKSSKKTKSQVSSPKTLKQTFIDDVSSSTVNMLRKPFSGYNLSDRRVEIFGKNSCFFSKDGTSVLTKYTIMIPGNAEYIILRVAPGNNNIEFWMHKALGDVETHILDTCESFRISSKNNLMIYIKKQSYMVPLPTVEVSFTRPVVEKDKPTKSSPHYFSSSKLQIMETKSFYSLNVTWPNGLITETVHEDNSANISHIKQHYIAPLTNSDEDMRCISLNGEVIIFKKSGLIETLRPNGSYIKITKCEKRINPATLLEDLHSDTSSDKSKKGKGKEKSKPSKASSKSSKNVIDNDEKISDIKAPEYELFIDEFETIEADGLKQKWVNDTPIDTKKLLIRTATDYCSGEVFSRRMDGTSILLNKDGIQIVTFPDNTRIITTFIVEETEIYPEWTNEEIDYFTMFDSDIVENGTLKSKSSSSQRSYVETYRQSNSVPSLEEVEAPAEIKPKERKDGYISIQIIFIIEHKNFATVTLNKADGKITVTSPNDVSVTLSPENDYNFTLDNLTKAEFNGQDLNITYKACLQCEAYTTCKVKIKYDEIPSATNFHKCWLRMEDSFNKNISVNDEGSINIIEDCVSDEVPFEEDSNIDKVERKGRKVKSETSLGKCREVYDAKAMRFFILRRELTCSELVHRALVDLYKQNCRWQPWCSINQYDTFGDNRSILSILTPVHLTETEKWLMESQFADKPKYLTYKDLKEDTGKGFYHWMRPSGRFKPTYRKPENVVPDRLPRAFVLRNLEQQWGDSKRQKLKGAKELLKAILRYRRLMEADSDTILYVPIRDLRPEDERKIDDIIQAIANRTYEDLKYRLAEDVQKRAKPTITTKPLSRSEDLSLEGESEEIPDELVVMEEKRASVVKEVEAVVEISPNLKRYWRRRAEEYKEEQFYKYLLREGSVPPYFRNVLGGAIWWEMNNITDEAATKAERRKMKCVCEEQEDTTA
ncbi:uncharacterized protein [Epargyreus clarus]|uniref:uncharacterized protein n=1 Tax=Epargyreus clarus TaxID=520877 RepID=UPI003C2D82B2